jgi:hypothetical protein
VSKIIQRHKSGETIKLRECNNIEDLTAFLTILSNLTLIAWKQWYETKKKLKTINTPEGNEKLQCMEESLRRSEKQKWACAEKLNIMLEKKS